VIDMTRALAGPFCTLILAALGADVIKIEDPAGGDISRDNAPYLGTGGLSLARTDPDAMSLAVLNRCRGKRSITLDLKRPGATQVFSDLVRHADIVVENFSSGTADRLGVGYAVARAANPAVVYCSISGFGADTSNGVRAMDTIIQALSGVMLTSGAPGEPPVRVGVPMADVLTPVWAVAGILAALHRRTVRNVGEHVDVSMLGTLTSLVATEDWSAMEQLGQELRTGNTLPRLAPFGIYRCADGWVSIVAPQDKLVTDLFTVMGRQDLLTDPRFAGRDARVRHEGELTRQIELWTGERPVAEVVARLSAADVPAAPVRTPQQAVADERVTAREETLPVLHPVLGDFAGLRTSGIPFRLAGATVGFARPAPRLGEHTAQVLTEVAGYTAGQVAALRQSGVTGEELPVELLPASAS
jgi:crotonobetainyl-CoA:carnitine CoA-transferase CaiB-like acyl-CoA transferase